MRLFFDMDWRWLYLHAVLCDRSGCELGCRPLARIPAASYESKDFESSVRWVSKNCFRYTGPKGMLDREVTTVRLADFIAENTRNQ